MAVMTWADRHPSRQSQQLDTRRELCDLTGVTLNGEPAVIVGARNPFAKVATLRHDGPVVEFAWETVAHIVSEGGAFKS